MNSNAKKALRWNARLNKRSGVVGALTLIILAAVALSGEGIPEQAPTAHAEEPAIETTVTPASDCAEVVDERRGGRYDCDGFYRVKVTNRCSVTRSVQICIQKNNGKWDCGVEWNVGAGRNMSYWSCDSNGEVRVQDGPAGYYKFKDPD